MLFPPRVHDEAEIGANDCIGTSVRRPISFRKSRTDGTPPFNGCFCAGPGSECARTCGVYDLVMYVGLFRRCLLPCGFLPLLGLVKFVALSPARKLKHLQCWFDGLPASMSPLVFGVPAVRSWSCSHDAGHGPSSTGPATGPPNIACLVFESKFLNLIATKFADDSLHQQPRMSSPETSQVSTLTTTNYELLLRRSCKEISRFGSSVYVVGIQGTYCT